MLGVSLDLRLAGAVAEDKQVRRAAVQQPHRDARVGRVDERALALHEEQLLPPAPVALDDEPLRGARDEVGDDCVHRDAPARDHDPRLAGRDEPRCTPAPPGLEVELERDRLFADRALGADGVDDRRWQLEVLARRDREPVGRAAEVAQLDVVVARERGQLRVVADELVEPALDVEPGCDAPLQQLAPLGREAAALRRHADERRVGLQGKRLLQPGDDRDAVQLVAQPLRVEQAGDVVPPVANDAARGLAVVRVARVALGEDQVPRH
jgi:hypothetical protein